MYSLVLFLRNVIFKSRIFSELLSSCLETFGTTFSVSAQLRPLPGRGWMVFIGSPDCISVCFVILVSSLLQVAIMLTEILSVRFCSKLQKKFMKYLQCCYCLLTWQGLVYNWLGILK